MKCLIRNIQVVCFASIMMMTCDSFAQEERKIERLWFSANHGFNRYNEVGGQVQIFSQLLLSAYYQRFKRNVGPGLPRNPNALFSFYYYKQNVVNSGSLMIGFASPTPHGVVISFLVGPSLNRNRIQTNVHIAESNSGGKFISSTETKSWKVGLNYKVTLGICSGNRVSVNLGLAGNYNGIDNYNRFILGIGVGLFGRTQ